MLLVLIESIFYLTHCISNNKTCNALFVLATFDKEQE